MSGVDYPPSRTIRLGDALEAAEAKADDEGTDGGWETYRDGLSWAVDQWGEDAEISVEAFTGASRARILDTARQHTVGELGRSRQRNALIAGSVIAAPWFDGDDDLATRLRVTGELPPALLDWLDQEVAELNELGN